MSQIPHRQIEYARHSLLRRNAPELPSYLESLRTEIAELDNLITGLRLLAIKAELDAESVAYDAEQKQLNDIHESLLRIQSAGAVTYSLEPDLEALDRRREALIVEEDVLFAQRARIHQMRNARAARHSELQRSWDSAFPDTTAFCSWVLQSNI